LAEETNLSPEQQILSVISWLAVLTLLQLSLWPSLRKTFGNLAFPAAFSGSVLIFTFLTWWCGVIRMPVQVGIIPFVALFIYNLSKGKYTIVALKAEWRWELLFLFCFFLMLDVRFVNPTISYAEKFMDHAFLASVIRNPVVPPLDPWFAGGTLNVYYYLGYWMLGCLSIVSGVPSNVAFNLSLPTIFALAAVNVYAIGTLLLDRFRWLPLLTFLLPNPSFFYQMIQGKVLDSVFWDSTRTITNTINEYPLFSFVWGDVHAHVISIFNQAFLLFVLVFAYKRWETLDSKGRWVVVLLAAISLGSMPLINTWDVLIYAPITIFTGLLILRRVWKTTATQSSFIFLFTIPILAIISYLPFYLELRTSTGGIGVVHTPSDPFEFLLVNGFFIAIITVFLAKDIVKRPWLLIIAVPFFLAGYPAAAIASVPAIYCLVRIFINKEAEFSSILAFLGLAILVIVELFYLKDNMGDTYFRMNTVFKAYLPAWIMLGLASFSMVAAWLTSRMPVLSFRKAAVLVVIVTALLFITPFIVSYNAGYGTGTLDGLAYLENTHPGDAAAVAFLRNLTGNETIVEAENGDYSYYSRVSSFTGIPAIIGQPFHEFMWRGDASGWFTSRRADIRTIYEQPDQTITLMKKYNATLLYIGDSERQRYQVNITEIPGLQKIYSASGVDIFRLSQSYQ
jgi:YYY domain-containing protein